MDWSNFFKRNEPQKVNLFGKEVEVHPQALVNSQLGIECYHAKDYPAAIKAFSKAIALMPKNQNFYMFRGTAYEDMGKDEEAQKDFEMTLRLHPGDHIAAFRLGMLYSRQNDLDRAIRYLEIAAEHALDLTDLSDLHAGKGKNNLFFVGKQVILNNLGNFLVQSGEIEKGFGFLEKAIELDPDYPQPYMGIGMTLARMGNARQGLSFVQKAGSLGAPQADRIIEMIESIIAEEESSGDNDGNDLEIDIVFNSSDHIRYQSGQLVSGPHGGAARAVKIEPNIEGNPGYSVTIYNLDGNHPLWRNNIMMATKQMRLTGADDEKIDLRGYGHDVLGNSFSDYGMTIYHHEGVVQKCVLHMFDRDVSIEYLP